MTDNIPENVNLDFIARQMQRVLTEMGAMRAGIQNLAIGQAALSTDLKEVKAEVTRLRDTVEIIESDISVMKKRIERIETNTGLVKA